MSNLRTSWHRGLERKAPVIRRITIEERAGGDYDIFVDGDEVMASRLTLDEVIGAASAALLKPLGCRHIPFMRPPEDEYAYRRKHYIEPFEKDEEVPF